MTLLFFYLCVIIYIMPEYSFSNKQPNPTINRGAALFDLGELIARDNLSIAENELPIASMKANEISKRLETDPMTGALNREGLNTLFNEYAALGPEGFGVLSIDLKDFKKFNDTNPKKHLGGDELLVGFATQTQSFVRHKNGGMGDKVFVARTGGDEFVVFFDLHPRNHIEESDLSPQQRLETAATNLLEHISESELLENSGVDISMGTAVWDGKQTLKQIMEVADRNMYAHKSEQIAETGSYR